MIGKGDDNKTGINITSLYQDYTPPIIDAEYLKSLELEIPDAEKLELLTDSSYLIKKLYSEKKLSCFTHNEIIPYQISKRPSNDLHVQYHGNTPKCPRIVELNPAEGCQIFCLYCLAIYTDEVKSDVTVYEDYHEYVSELLKSNNGSKTLYYLSPKTEAFQDALLETGITHNILKAFIDHFERDPTSKASLLIVTKGGKSQIEYSFHGETVMDLLVRLGNRVKFFSSNAPMPDDIRCIIEPFAPSFNKRIDMMKSCKEKGIDISSVIIQPLLEPFLQEDELHEYFSLLSGLGVISAKIEFLTLSYLNMAFLFPIIGHANKDAERILWKHRLRCDLKKGGLRIPPDKKYLLDHLYLCRDIARRSDIYLTLCNWVKDSLNIGKFDNEAYRRGFGCMGHRIGEGAVLP